MSRCDIDLDSLGGEAVLGWDPGLQTYFLQVIGGDEDNPLLCLGTAFEEILDVEHVIAMLGRMAKDFDPDVLAANLRYDRRSNSSRVYTLEGAEVTGDVVADLDDPGMSSKARDDARLAAADRIAAADSLIAALQGHSGSQRLLDGHDTINLRETSLQPGRRLPRLLSGWLARLGRRA